ncbi:transglycosylase SLT domain-containing protein [Sinobacterium caligoides]|uniref:transglycosylase SLT domain-containing protein n=1 Tax=Sinobacterium caligoides TaxID=933926 RepID=UPI0011CDAE9E|nr:transglycosylase SLT domain-containing protein [Sinobacterium caligoides]
MIIILSLSPEASAQVISNTQRVQQRLLYIEAIQATENNDTINFQRLYQQLAGYPLRPYLEYHQLLKNFGTIDDADVGLFLRANTGSLIAERLQYLWLRHKVQLQDWPGFIKHDDETRFQSTDMQCARLLAHSGNNVIAPNLHNSVRQLWAQNGTLHEQCLILFSNALQQAIIADDDIWARYLSLFKSNTDNANTLYFYLNPKDQHLANQLLKARSSPEQASTIYSGLSLNENLLVSAYAIKKLAELSPPQAMLLLPETKLTKQAYEKSAYYIAWQITLESPGDAYQWLKTIDTEFQHPALTEFKITLALTNNHWQEISSLIEQLPHTLQMSPRWQYWSIRAQEKSSPSESARWQKHYQALAQQRNYYGFLAAARSKTPPQFNDQSQPLTPQITHTNGIFQQNASLRRAIELYHFGATKLARREWQHGIASLNPSQQRMVAVAAHHNQLHHQSVQTIIQAQLWDHLNLRFPTAYRYFVKVASESTQIHPSWLFAIIRQESQFDPGHRSSVGEIGLMQLQIKHGQSHERSKTLLDPRINIQLGARYFKQLLDRFNNNYSLACAAYEAGPDIIESWVEKNRQITDLDQWIESIPYQQVRHYVQNTLVFNAIYRYLLGQPSMILADHQRFPASESSDFLTSSPYLSLPGKRRPQE